MDQNHLTANPLQYVFPVKAAASLAIGKTSRLANPWRPMGDSGQ